VVGEDTEGLVAKATGHGHEKQPQQLFVGADDDVQVGQSVQNGTDSTSYVGDFIAGLETPVLTTSNTLDVVVTACATVIDVAAAPTIAPSMTSVDDFISSISSDLCPPILTLPPRLRVSQVPDYSVVPRRSTRLADKPRAPNPEVQATNVMLKKLGKYVLPPTTVDSGARRFRETFSGSLSPSTKEVMRELFPARKRFGAQRAAV
jgi:hypothetical protein